MNYPLVPRTFFLKAGKLYVGQDNKLSSGAMNPS